MKYARLKEKLRKNPVYIKAVAVLLTAVICFVCLYMWDNSRQISTNADGQKILERGETGEDRVSGMKARIGDTEKEVDVEVSGRAYTEEELRQAFEEAGTELERLILGENETLDEVRTALKLVTEIPGTEISVSWEMDRHDVIDMQGNIRGEELTEEGTLVNLTAVLKYEEEKSYHEFAVMVYPRKVSRDEAVTDSLLEEVARADEETKSEEYLVLPDQIDGDYVEWSYQAEERAYAVLAIGVWGACMLVVSARQKKKEDEKKAARQMQLDYPQIINKFNLYIRAGMTVRRAWFLIARDYEKKRPENGRTEKNKRKAYEEMLFAMYQIQGGMPESECYENFGIRCGISAYRKFGTMLAQNLRKGSRGLTDILAREAQEAFEERKKLAKKLGEEAATKLMIPLFLMLIVVFAVVIVPAFFSIQI